MLRLSLVLCLIFVSGCASLSYGKKQTDNAFKLQLGMTKEQVMAVLDPPDYNGAQGNREVWAYNLMKNGEFFEKVVPYVCVFDNGKLVHYGVNDEAVRQQQVNQAIQAQQLQNTQQSLQNFSNQLAPRQPAQVAPMQNQRCTTRSDGFGGYTTECFP